MKDAIYKYVFQKLHQRLSITGRRLPWERIQIIFGHFDQPFFTIPDSLLTASAANTFLQYMTLLRNVFCVSIISKYCMFGYSEHLN
jgi:hypothetical protein